MSASGRDSKVKRTPEDVCIEYALVTGLMREETAKIKPWDCERVAAYDALPEWSPDRPAVRVEPCISTLFQKRDEDNVGYQEHRDWQNEFEDEMCDRCRASLKAVRDRKALRMRLGAAKRSIQAIGKRLNALPA